MTKFKTVIALATTLALTACANVERLTSGVDNQCESLQAIAKDASSGFKETRGAASDFSKVRIYKARTQLITGHCEVWEWGNGEIAYVCSASSPSQEVAEARYQTSTQAVQQCLSSPAWQQSSEGTTGDDLQDMQLSNAELNVKVRLRMLKVAKSIRAEYANYLLVQPM